MTVTPGTLLATKSYGPASQVTYNLNANYVQIMDATNLTLSFTVPASGSVYIDVAADWGIFPQAGLSQASDLFMAVVLHGTNAGTALSSPQSWGGTDNENGCTGGRGLHRYYCTGLTPGAIQVDLAMGISSTDNFAAAFYATAWDGTTAINTDPTGPIEIQAFAA